MTNRIRARAKGIWAFIDRIGWIIAIVFVAIALWKIHHDEKSHNREAERTRAVQKAGEPVGVCLLDTLEAVKPLLLRVPTVEEPLEAYVRLQSHRYMTVTCPTRVYLKTHPKG